KYFILPKLSKMDHEDRGTFSFLVNAEGGQSQVLGSSPGDEDDFLVLKNHEVFPRAWIVHRADIRPPIHGLRRSDRKVPMEQLLYRERDGGIPLWAGVKYGNYPLRSQVMLESTQLEDLLAFQSNQPVAP